MSRRILFVCSGNVCRSPLAHYMFEQIVQERRYRGVRVASGGTLGLSGDPAAEGTLQVLLERGVNAEVHRSAALKFYHLWQADLIIVMEPLHREWIRNESGNDPAIMERTFVITEFHPQPLYRNAAGIFDFVLSPLEVYRDMSVEFSRLLESLADYCAEIWPEIRPDHHS